MVKIEEAETLDTRDFTGGIRRGIESYTNVIQAKDLSIGYDAPLAEVSFAAEKGASGDHRGRTARENLHY